MVVDHTCGWVPWRLCTLYPLGDDADIRQEKKDTLAAELQKRIMELQQPFGTLHVALITTHIALPRALSPPIVP